MLENSVCCKSHDSNRRPLVSMLVSALRILVSLVSEKLRVYRR